jgi:hypothetical protein
LPHRKVGSHRRVAFDDLIDWGPGLRMALWEGYKRRKASTQKGK